MKIIFSFFLIFLLSFVIPTIVNRMALRELGRFTLNASRTLGFGAAVESRKALIDQEEDILKSLAKSQSIIFNGKFKRIVGEIETICRICDETINSPGVRKSSHVVTGDTVPADKLSFSSLTFMPGIDPSKIQVDADALSHMHNFLKITYTNNRLLSLLYVASPQGAMLKYPWGPSPPGFDFRKRAWYTEALSSEKEVWSTIYVSATFGHPVLTCSKAVRGKNGEVLAVVGVDINVDSISEDFISLNEQEHGYAFVIDRKGSIIAGEKYDDGSLDWAREIKTKNLFDSDACAELARRMTAGESGMLRCEFPPHGDKYVAFAPIRATGWSVGISMPEKSIIQPAVAMESRIAEQTDSNADFIQSYTQRIQMLQVIGSTVFLLLVITAAYFLSARITKPILELQKTAAGIGRGDLERRIDLKTGDELQQLAETINKMTGDLKLYIQNLKETVAAKERIESDLKIAAEIQSSMLPNKFPAFPGRFEIDIHAMMQPAREVGGDFYDFFFIDKSRLFFSIGDVSGKGVSAALFMALTKTVMSAVASSNFTPDEILTVTNNHLVKNNEADMFATVFCGILDVGSGEVVYSNAGHNPPLLKKAGGVFSYLSIPPGRVIGPMPAAEGVYKILRLPLSPGDTLFLYTDGVTEAMCASNDMYGEERLSGALNKSPESAPRTLVEELSVSLKSFTGSTPQSDDITMLALSFAGDQNQQPQKQA